MNENHGRNMTSDAVTVVASIFVAGCPPVGATNVELQVFGRLLGLQNICKVNYIMEAIARRWKYDKWRCGAVGDIRVGERVAVKHGGVGHLISSGPDGVIIEMEDTGDHLKYGSTGRSGARMRRQGPDIIYRRDHGRSDTDRSVKAQAIRAFIWKWHESANVMSPNIKDTMKKRKAFKRYDEMVKIYRMLTWDDLWSLFKEDPANKDVVDHLQSNIEYVCTPPVFITSAPWYLVKGKNEACLCL